MLFIRLSMHRFLDRLCKDWTYVCLFNVHAANCKPCYKYMFNCCLVSSLSPMVFYNILLPMFSAGRSPTSLLLVCVPPRPTAAWLLLRSVVPYHSLFLLLLRPSRQVRLLFLSTSLLSLGYPSPTPPSLFLTGYFNAQVSGFRYPSPAPPRLFLTGYFDAQVSAFRYPSPAPPRLLLTGYLDAQVSGFRCPSPAPPRLFLAGYLDAQVSVFRCPSPAPPRLFLAGYLDAQVSLFRYPPFFPPNLPFPVTWVAGSLFVPPCGTPAVFTVPRFLPLRGFLPLRFRRFFGGSALPPPSCLLPPSLHPLPGGSLFVPPFGTPAIFTAPRFLPLRFRRFFGGSALPPPSCLLPPSLHPLPGGSLFVPPFGTPAIFTAPRFLPLRGFYRSAVFTASLSPVFWGLCSFAALMLAAPQSSPTSGRTLWCRLVRSISGGPPFLTLFLYRLIDRSRSVTAHLTGFPFVHFIHIRGPSIVSSFECRDTGTTCTTTSLMGPFGYRKLGNLTYHRLL